MPKQQLNDKDRIFGLDLMRATAILMVLSAHCIWIFPGESGTFSQILALSGFLGVEIFFVLSGFLIGRILFRLFTKEEFKLVSVISFLKRRWYRTLPNYFLILLVNIAIAYMIGYGIENLWRYFFFIQNFGTPMPAFFPESWSLSVEEYAYVFLPFILLAVALSRTNRSTIFLVITLLLIVLCIGAKILYHVQTKNTSLEQWNVALKAVVIFRLDSIFIGVLFSWIFSMYHQIWVRTKYFWLAGGIFMMCFFTAGVGFLRLTLDNYPIFWNVIYLPAASLAIAFFLPFLSEWKTEKPFIRRPITFISLISYSIYLLHYSVILQTLKQIVDTEKLSSVMIVAFTVFYVATTFVLSYLLYTFYERPMMERRESKAAGDPAIT
ncbi:MAG: acyltransferase [Flavisolibacter sp.]|nr:acyltransferase [Flavisolibacter sp.]